MGIYADIPLTDEVRRALAGAWPEVDAVVEAERLHGGEESTAYRLGKHVVRIGPMWRTSVDAEWCHAIAAHAATRLSEAVAPLPVADGETVVRVGDRPISVWPYVAGSWPDEQAEPSMRRQAAALLARLHRALAEACPRARPTPSMLSLERVGERFDSAPDDAELDRWLQTFDRPTQLLHGDFYAGNTLARDGRLVAVLDWDEAFHGPPELELASAALEWSDDYARDLTALCAFVADYHAVGGTAGALDEESLVQLIRHRLRQEAVYFEIARRRGVQHDADDHEYHERRLDAFHRLRP